MELSSRGETVSGGTGNGSHLVRGDAADNATTTPTPPLADGSHQQSNQNENENQNQIQNHHQNQDQDLQDEGNNLHNTTSTTTTTSPLLIQIPDPNEDSPENSQEKDQSSMQSAPRTSSHHIQTSTFSDRDEFAVRGLLALGMTGMAGMDSGSETEPQTQTQSETPVVMSSNIPGLSPSIDSSSSSSAGNDNARSRRNVPQQKEHHEEKSQQGNKTSRDDTNFPVSPPTTLSNDLSGAKNSISPGRESRTMDLLRHYRYEVAPWVSLAYIPHCLLRKRLVCMCPEKLNMGQKKKSK